MPHLDLAQGLRLIPPTSDPTSIRLALVGAGGKSTALFRLARSLPGPILVTATTHLSVNQLALADRHLTATQPSDLDALEAGLPPGVTLITGPLGVDRRTAGLDPLTLEKLHALANQHAVPLLLEADGSRRLPVKAPAAHEPPIPAFMRQVGVVAGLSALGQPIHPAWVHRPERFASLAHAEPGQTITPAHLARVLAHPEGGLKNIPAGARRICLLNQADTPALQQAGKEIAHLLLAEYDAVLVTRLLNPPGEGVFGVFERVAGVVLAAGESRRLGQPKQLLTWQGEPFVRRAARQALEAGLNPVCVVTGAYADEVRLALTGLPVCLVDNPHWQAGQSTSLQAGLAALPAETGACLFLLSDQPQLPQALLTALVDAHTDLPSIAAPQVDGKRANPVLFDRRTFAALMALQGDTGGRPLFQDPEHFPVAWVPWKDPSLLLDVDTLEDYQKLNQSPGEGPGKKPA